MTASGERCSGWRSATRSARPSSSGRPGRSRRCATWSAAGRSRCPRARGRTTPRWRCAWPSRWCERRDVRPRRPARALRALVPRGALVEHRTLLRHRQRDPRGARALRAHRRAVPGDAAPDAAGNGPLMKLAPVVLAYASRPDEPIRFAGESARTTHGALEAVDASGRSPAAARGARGTAERRAARAERRERPSGAAGPSGASGAAGPSGAVGPSGTAGPSGIAGTLHPGVAAALTSTREPPEVRGGGYVVDALEAALWALRTTTSFEDGVLAAVNLGDDADTTAAIYGQLAGALYGLDGIPARWRAARASPRRDRRVRGRAARPRRSPPGDRAVRAHPAAAVVACALARATCAEALAPRAATACRSPSAAAGHDFAGALVDDRRADRHAPDATRSSVDGRHGDRRRGRAARRDLRRARPARPHDRRGLRTRPWDRGAHARRRDRDPRAHATGSRATSSLGAEVVLA